MSLPSRLHLDPTSLKQNGAYLTITHEAVERWRLKLKRRTGHRLMACTGKATHAMKARSIPRGRSMPFAVLGGLEDLEAVEFVSVQRGAGSEQLRLDAGLPFVAGQGEVSASMDFVDTAAVLANCDLPNQRRQRCCAFGWRPWHPHLGSTQFCAGMALGSQGERSPWYSTLRLFRQTSPMATGRTSFER